MVSTSIMFCGTNRNLICQLPVTNSLLGLSDPSLFSNQLAQAQIAYSILMAKASHKCL